MKSENDDFKKATESLQSVLKSQYHAALAMLRETLEQCPEESWSSKEHTNAFWQIAYHALFFAHLYLQPNETTFRPWKDHQADVQYPDGIAGPPEPESKLNLLPTPYTKAQLLEYWNFCDQFVENAIEAFDIHSPESGFSWYKVSKLEHQMINIRHIQHHAAQLADRLRFASNIGIQWVGARHKKK